MPNKSDMSFSEGGLISLRKLDGTVLSLLALLKEGAERTIISKGLLKDLGYCEIDDADHPDVTNLWLDGKIQFSFPRRTPSVRMTSTQAMTDIHVSGLIEIPDNIFEIAMPRQEFQLTEHKPVDHSEPTVGRMSLTIRVASGVPPPHSDYADRQATHILQRLPTTLEIAEHKPTKEHPRPLSPNEKWTGQSAPSYPRPLSPNEKWTGQSAPSFQALHSEISTFGMEGFAHKPKETRAKGDIPGVRVVYLCPATPKKALNIATGNPFIKMHQGTYPFLIELRKSIPTALLSFELATLELIKIKAVAAPVAAPTPVAALTPVAVPLALLKPFDPGGGAWGGEQELPGPMKTKAQLKSAGKPDPTRFTVNDKVMTLEGPVLVVRLTGTNIPKDSMNLSWPDHHNTPSTVYTVKRAMAWYISERPGEIYDSHGNHIHESNLVDIKRVMTEMHAPEQPPTEEHQPPEGSDQAQTAVFEQASQEHQANAPVPPVEPFDFEADYVNLRALTKSGDYLHSGAIRPQKATPAALPSSSSSTTAVPMLNTSSSSSSTLSTSSAAMLTLGSSSAAMLTLNSSAAAMLTLSSSSAAMLIATSMFRCSPLRCSAHAQQLVRCCAHAWLFQQFQQPAAPRTSTRKAPTAQVKRSKEASATRKPYLASKWFQDPPADVRPPAEQPLNAAQDAAHAAAPSDPHADYNAAQDAAPSDPHADYNAAQDAALAAAPSDPHADCTNIPKNAFPDFCLCCFFQLHDLGPPAPNQLTCYADTK